MRSVMVVMLLAMLGCDGGDDKPDGDSPASPGDTTQEDTGVSQDTGDSMDVPAGPTGLEGYCERYKECGGTYYATAEDCVDATLSYWGDCPEMRTALDAFGDCMMDISCDDYNPDSYNPASTDCADEWSDVYDADC